MSEIAFTAEILNSPKYPNAAFVFVPGDLKKLFGTLKPRVNIYYDHVLYRGTIANMGEGPIAILPKEIRAKLKKTHGDLVEVKITLDTEVREIEMPEELLELLKEHQLLKVFNTLSYSKRKEMARGITSAKREETKHKRLAAVLVQLKAIKVSQV